jgi:hypothetical protein
MIPAVKKNDYISFEDASGVLDRVGKIRNKEGKQTFQARCPIHGDRTPSLSVTEGDNGEALFFCFSCCAKGDKEGNKKYMNKIYNFFKGEAVTPIQSTKKKAIEEKLLPLTLQQLADEKGIPFDSLREYGLYQGAHGKQQIPCVMIPSFTPDGEIHKRKQVRMLKETETDDGEKVIQKAIKRTGSGDIILYGLDRLKQAKETGHLFLVEGESDCWTLWLHEQFPALGIPGANNTELLELEYLDGIRSLYIINEKDNGAATFITGIIKRLEVLGWNGETNIVTMPDGCKDPNELHIQLQDKERFMIKMIELIGEAKTGAQWMGEQETAASNVISLVKKRRDSNPSIFLDGQLGDQTDNVLDAFHRYSTNLYQRSGMLVRIFMDEINDIPVIERISNDTLYALATKNFNFKKTKKVTKQVEGGEITETVIMSVNPPERLFKNILSLKEDWNFPKLTTLSVSPVVRKDGTFITNSGYDQQLKQYFHMGDKAIKVSDIPDKPTKEEIKKAVDILKHEAFADVAFESETDFSHAVALALTPIIQPLLDRDETPPAFVIGSPKRGTGKGFLFKIIQNIVYGRQMGVMPLPEREEEKEKRLAAIAMQSLPMVVFDNVRGKLKSESLEAFITEKVWTLRVLNKSEIVTTPKNTIIVITGNNLETNEDMGSRICWINLDTKSSKPDRRAIKNEDILSSITKNRGLYLGTLLTLVRAWFADGCPTNANVGKGRFRQWRKIVGNILATSGIEGFMQQDESEVTEEEEQWALFLRTWERTIPEPKTVSELVSHFSPSKENNFSAEAMQGSLPDLLPNEIAFKIKREFNETDKQVATKIGLVLKSKINEPFGKNNWKIQFKRTTKGRFYYVTSDEIIELT